LRSVSALVLLAVDDSDQKTTFEQMVGKQIEALRKQLDETDTSSSVLRQEPMPVATRESQNPSQLKAHGGHIPKEGGTAEVELSGQDIQSRAKAALAYDRSFIA